MSDEQIQQPDPAEQAASAAAGQQLGLRNIDQLENIKFWSEDDINDHYSGKTASGNEMRSNPLWGLANKELALSIVDVKRDRARFSNKINILRSGAIMAMSSNDITPQYNQQVENLIARLECVRFNRADQGFERRLQATSVLSIDRSVTVKKPPSMIQSIGNKIMRKKT